MRWIKLDKGKRTSVDDEDYARLVGLAWLATWCPGDRRWRAVRSGKAGEPKMIYMHRVIMRAGRGELVDHASRDTLDNQKDNLRKCTRAQNAWNSRRRISGKTSRYKGVCFNDGNVIGHPWRATITVNGKQKYLGFHKTQRAAAWAYDLAAREHFGEFALTNFKERP